MKTTLPFRIEADGQPSFASTVLAELRESSKALLVRVLKANDNAEGVVADAGDFENLIKDLKGGPNAVFKFMSISRKILTGPLKRSKSRLLRRRARPILLCL